MVCYTQDGDQPALAVLAAAILIFINEAGFRLSTQAATSIEAAQETRAPSTSCCNICWTPKPASGVIC